MNKTGRKIIVSIGQIFLFILCMFPATSIVLWHACKIRLGMSEVKFIDSPALGIPMFILTVIFYIICEKTIKFVYRKIRKNKE